MTLAALIAGRRRFDRLTRAQLEAQVEQLRTQRDRALAARRAQRDQLAAWLATRADGYREDAAHLDRLRGTQPASDGPLTAGQRRAVAAELEQLANDIDHLGRR